MAGAAWKERSSSSGKRTVSKMNCAGFKGSATLRGGMSSSGLRKRMGQYSMEIRISAGMVSALSKVLIRKSPADAGVMSDEIAKSVVSRLNHNPSTVKNW